MHIITKVFNRPTTFNGIEDYDKAKLKMLYDILHINWCKASDTCDWFEADNIESDMNLISYMYRS